METKKLLIAAIILVVIVIAVVTVVSSPGVVSMGPSITEMYENDDCDAFNNYLKTHTQVEIQESLSVAESQTYVGLAFKCASELDVTGIFKP